MLCVDLPTLFIINVGLRGFENGSLFVGRIGCIYDFICRHILVQH